MVTVDVLVPCYNYGCFLWQCVSSVLHQQGCQVRVLIIDDASTDNSLEVAHAIAESDCRVAVVAHPTNRGHIATYNEGIEWVQSEYMLLLSADDLIAPMALTRATNLMEAHPNVGFVYGRAVRFTDEAEIAREIATASSDDEEPPAMICKGLDFIKSVCFDPINKIETVTTVVRTSLQKRIGGYLAELPHAGDYEMWLRFAAHGDVGVIDAVQGFVRIHSSNMRCTYESKRMYGDFQQRLAALRTFFMFQANLLPELDEISALAYRRLAEEVFWTATGAFEEGSVKDAAELAKLAKAIWPGIVQAPFWWKLSAKRIIGPRWWRAIAPYVDEARNFWFSRWRSS